MKKISLLLLALTVLFCSCSKDDDPVILDREKFIGTYSGLLTSTIIANNEIISHEEYDVTRTITVATDEDEIIITGISDTPIKANVSGNMIDIPIQYFNAEIEDTTAEYTAYGSGSMTIGDKLTLSYSFDVIYGGILFHYTRSETLRKY